MAEDVTVLSNGMDSKEILESPDSLHHEKDKDMHFNAAEPQSEKQVHLPSPSELSRNGERKDQAWTVMNTNAVNRQKSESEVVANDVNPVREEIDSPGINWYENDVFESPMSTSLSGENNILYEIDNNKERTGDNGSVTSSDVFTESLTNSQLDDIPEEHLSSQTIASSQSTPDMSYPVNSKRRSSIGPIPVSPSSSTSSVQRNPSTGTPPNSAKRKGSVGRFTITPVSPKSSLSSSPGSSPVKRLSMKEDEKIASEHKNVVVQIIPPDVHNRNNSNIKSSAHVHFEDENSPPGDTVCTFFLHDETHPGDSPFDVDHTDVHEEEEHEGYAYDNHGLSVETPRQHYYKRSASTPHIGHHHRLHLPHPKLPRRSSEHAMHSKEGNGFNHLRDSVRVTKHIRHHRPHYMHYEEAEAVLERKKALEQSMKSRTVEPKSNDYLPFACVVMLCCNLPIGLIALFFSVSSNYSYENEEYEKSRKQSRVAFILSITGVLLTVLLLVILLAVFWPEMPEDTKSQYNLNPMENH